MIPNSPKKNAGSEIVYYKHHRMTQQTIIFFCKLRLKIMGAVRTVYNTAVFPCVDTKEWCGIYTMATDETRTTPRTLRVQQIRNGLESTRSRVE